MLPTVMRHVKKIDVQMKPWMEDYHFEMVTPDNIERVMDECIEAGVYGLDLECTGLDTRIFPRETENGVVNEVVLNIVGICLSPGKKRSYYLPILHQPLGVSSPHNVPFSVWDGPFRRLLKSTSKPVVHNCKYEGEVLTFSGLGEPYGDWDDIRWWHDTQILAYLDDSNRKQLGLKAMSKELLNKEQIELEELFPPGTKLLNFSLLDPADPAVLAYAASDAVCTLELYHLLAERAVALTHTDSQGNKQNQNFVLGVEKLCVPAVRWMERARLPIDIDLVGDFICKAKVALIDSLQDLYKGASEILGRDITPLSFYLVCKELAKDPSWRSVSEDPQEKTLRMLFDECKKEASRFHKLYQKGDLQTLKDCEQDATLSAMMERVAPPPKAFGSETVQLSAEYDAMSPEQFGLLLFDLGVQGLQKTDTGQVKTSHDVLDEVIKENEASFPFMKTVKVFRGNDQALKNLVSIWRDTDRRDNSLRISFRAYAASTGRFSAKGDANPEATGGTTFNLQSMPAGKDPRSPEALLRIRECIRARPGKAMVIIDFSGVELRLQANVARETKWIDQFFKCSSCELVFPRGDGHKNIPVPPKYCPQCGSDKIGDIHTLTAIQIFGEDAPTRPDWSVLRAKGKNTNFALSYGGGPQAIQRQTGSTQNESYRIHKKFKSSYEKLSAWQKGRWDFARKHGYVVTAFNRKYLAPDINHEIQWVRSKAERNCINSPIQGCLHPESRIVTKQGVRTLQEIWDTCGSASIFEVWTGVKWSTASIVATGLKELRHTTLKNGTTLRTSPDHKFLVTCARQQLWKAQSELQVGDWVCLDNSGEKTCTETYGLTRVVSLETPSQTVPMFDIQVHDEDHAFVCDGVIVHNSSADITKLAMGRIYLRCKERGWLDKVHMLLTMHDELVFEVDLDIMEEAIEMFVDQMTNNAAILGRCWPVPLTVDVEFGHTWKAKLNLYAIQYEVDLRRKLQVPGQTDDEIKKLLRCVTGFYGKPEKVRKLKSFENMQWPEFFRPYFRQGREEVPFTEAEKYALARAWSIYFGEPLTLEVPANEDHTQFGTSEPLQTVTLQEVKPKPSVFSYTLPELTSVFALRVAEAIVQCSGTQQLELRSPTGEVLQGWIDKPAFVDAAVFTAKLGDV